MVFKNFVFAASIAAFATFPAARATARNGAAGAVGGIILLCLLGGCSQPSHARRATRSSMSTAQREENKQVQTALNYFNFPVGTVDGSIGSKSKTAISNFQTTMGYTVDGGLDDVEREFLLNSYQRAQTSSQVPPYSQIVANFGTQGLLRRYRDEERGTIQPAVQPSPQPAAPVPQPAALVPQPAAPVPGLPTFPASDQVEAASIDSFCSEISVLTSTNGGFTTLDTLGDPAFVLDEQFCLARKFALSESRREMESRSGTTDAQFVAQCEGLGTYMAPELRTLGQNPPTAVKAAVSNMLRSSGQSAEDSRLTGKICLGVGYREDDANVALAGALVLVGVNDDAYGEIIGHHLREGFGTGADPVKAEEWMVSTLSALEKGATPASRPDQSAEHQALLRAALAGERSPAPVPSGLPTFDAPVE